MTKTPQRVFGTVWKEGRYYVAQCLNVDVSSFGTTKKSALKNLQEAVELYFEDAPKKLQQVSKPEVISFVPNYA